MILAQWIYRNGVLAFGLPILLVGMLGLTAACAPQKRTYTVPSVTKEIEDSIRQARRLKDQGKLKDASRLLLQVGRAVLSEYPQTTVTQESANKLIEALEWIANLSLDRSLELRNESISPQEDKLSKDFSAWSGEHRENATKIRDLLPRLQKAEVAPARPAAADSKAPRPAEPGTDRPVGPGEPRPAEPRQPAPDDPSPPAAGDNEEPR